MSQDWDRPFPLGFPAAIEAAGSVASPLLAGFSFALVGLVVPAPENFRWPSLTLALLLSGGIAFIAAVQCAFWVSQYSITINDVELWRPDYSAERKIGLQRLHRQGFKIWARRFNASYRLGILLLLLGVTFALVPPGDIDMGRYLVIAVAALGFLGELGWVGAAWLLAGSPGTAYNTQLDEPSNDVRFPRLRRAPRLRRIARTYIPLVRIEVGTRSGPADGHDAS